MDTFPLIIITVWGIDDHINLPLSLGARGLELTNSP